MTRKADGGLRSTIIEHIIGPHWQAIETGSTGRGIPDLNGCHKSREIWIECKAADHWAVVIDPMQVAWIERRARNGGHCFIAVKRAGTEFWLLAPGAARVLAMPRLGLRDLPERLILGRWAGGSRNWPWATIQGLVFPDIP